MRSAQLEVEGEIEVSGILSPCAECSKEIENL